MDDDGVPLMELQKISQARHSVHCLPGVFGRDGQDRLPSSSLRIFGAQAGTQPLSGNPDISEMIEGQPAGHGLKDIGAAGTEFDDRPDSCRFRRSWPPVPRAGGRRTPGESSGRIPRRLRDVLEVCPRISIAVSRIAAQPDDPGISSFSSENALVKPRRITAPGWPLPSRRRNSP